KMMPPTSGKQASAAAIFEGNPVDADLPDSDSEGGGGGGLCSAESGIGYIHRIKWRFVNSERVCRIDWKPRRRFCLSRPAGNQYRSPTMPRKSRHAFTLIELLVVIAIIAIL